MHEPNNDTDITKSKDRNDGTPSRRAGSDVGWIEGEDYYVNDNGLVTFTAKYLLERGYCCGNGCKHCPYNYEAVPEPKRSYLLSQRNDAAKGQ